MNISDTGVNNTVIKPDNNLDPERRYDRDDSKDTQMNISDTGVNNTVIKPDNNLDPERRYDRDDSKDTQMNISDTGVNNTVIKPDNNLDPERRHDHDMEGSFDVNQTVTSNNLYSFFRRNLFSLIFNVCVLLLNFYLFFAMERKYEEKFKQTKTEFDGKIEQAKTEFEGKIKQAKTEFEGKIKQARKEFYEKFFRTLFRKFTLREPVGHDWKQPFAGVKFVLQDLVIKKVETLRFLLPGELTLRVSEKEFVVDWKHRVNVKLDYSNLLINRVKTLRFKVCIPRLNGKGNLLKNNNQGKKVEEGIGRKPVCNIEVRGCRFFTERVYDTYKKGEKVCKSYKSVPKRYDYAKLDVCESETLSIGKFLLDIGLKGSQDKIEV